MPRAVAGQDFLCSVGDLFDEVLHKQPGHDGFALMRKQLVDLLQMLSETTAAKARANSPVKLPDGREPETHIQLPPATLKVDDSLARRLSGAADPAGFQAILSEAIEEQVASRSRKRKMECAAGDGDGDGGGTPRKRVVLKKSGLGPRTPGSPEKPATPISIGPPMMDLDEEGGGFPSPPNTNAVVKVNIEKGDEVVLSPSAFIKKVTQSVVPRTEQEIVGVVEEGPAPVLEQLTATEMADSDSDEDEDEDEESDYEMEDAKDDSMVADFSITSFNNTLSPPSLVSSSTSTKPDAAAEEIESAETLKQIIADVRNTTPEQWQAFRPKLLDSLLPYAEMEYAKLSSLGPTVAEDALTRLDAAVVGLGDDISVIPADNWQRYKQRLHKLCNARVFSTYNYAQRLRRVMDVVYLDEEADTMESGDWDRLEVVVKIIATVCEAMGPAEEESAEVSHKWFRSKVQDIRFLKRITTSINRKTEVLEV